MDQKVELAPELVDLGEHRVDRGRVGHVAMAHDRGVEFPRQRPHPLFERLALVGEGQFGARRARRLGDAPGDRPIVGDPHDEAAPAGQNTGTAAGRIAGLI